jgi:EmrB/QacA subfamily drug resistance transporter
MSQAETVAGAETQDAPSSVRVVVAAVAVLLLLAALDQTIVSTALPTIVADLGGLDQLSWVVTAYILSSTVVAPLYGKLGDLYGRRVMVFVSVGLFLVGSALCAAATSMPFLIAARGIQGLGGGGLFVLALSIVGDVIQPRDRGKVQGVFATVFGVSSVVGPLVGGWFVEAFTWHWIFLINLPIGAAALAGFALAFKANPEQVPHRIDYAGAVALSVALGSVVLVTSLGGRTLPWASPAVVGMIVLAVAALAAFLRIETRAEEPILPLGLFRMNVFWVTSFINFATGAALFGAITFLPLYLQIAKGSSPTVSGLLLVPMTLGILTASTIAGRFMGATGRYRWLPIIGTALMTVAMIGLSTLSADTPVVLFSAYLVMAGAGMGCIFPVVVTAVQNAVPREQMGTATAAGLMFRQIGGSVAVALFGAMLSASMAASLGGAAGDVTSEIGPQMLAAMDPDMRAQVTDAIVGALHPIYRLAAVVTLVGLGFALILQEVKLVNRMVPKGE